MTNLKRKFLDSAKTHDRMGILTIESLSANQEMTPEGFLLCRNVPIARTGDQLYTADEIGLESNGDGLVKIQRLDDEVFRPDTIASFEGKPVTIDHPNGVDVNPSNWRELAIGIVQNVRRGTGIEDDLLLADLLITDAQGIEAVRGKLREVSCGYDADYEQVSAGVGLQTNIIGNHVALVERGRAGARCSIRDKEIETMKTKTKAKTSFMDKLRHFLDAEAAELEKEEQKTADADADEEEKDKATADADEEVEKDDKKTDDADGTDVDARLTALEAAISEIKGMLKTKDADIDEDEAGDTKTEDEGGDLTEAETAAKTTEAMGVTFGDSMREIASRAEILVPGIKMPSGDAAKTKGSKENIMRKALTTALDNAAISDMIKPLLLGRSVAKLTGDSLAMAFNGASELVKAHNNAKGVRNGVTTKDFGKTNTPADINARNRELWAQK